MAKLWRKWNMKRAEVIRLHKLKLEQYEGLRSSAMSAVQDPPEGYIEDLDKKIEKRFEMIKATQFDMVSRKERKTRFQSEVSTPSRILLLLLRRVGLNSLNLNDELL
jgi:hypothetical protein